MVSLRERMAGFLAERLRASGVYHRVQILSWGALATEISGRTAAAICHTDPHDDDALRLFLLHHQHGSTIPLGHVFLQEPGVFRVPYKTIMGSHTDPGLEDYLEQERETIVPLQPMERTSLYRLHTNIHNGELAPQDRWRSELTYYRPEREHAGEALLICRTRPVDEPTTMAGLRGQRYWVIRTSIEIGADQAAVLQCGGKYARLRPTPRA